MSYSWLNFWFARGLSSSCNTVLGLWLTFSRFGSAFTQFSRLMQVEYTVRKISASWNRWSHIHLQNHPRTCAKARYCFMPRWSNNPMHSCSSRTSHLPRVRMQAMALRRRRVDCENSYFASSELGLLQVQKFTFQLIFEYLDAMPMSCCWKSDVDREYSRREYSHWLRRLCG